MQLLFERDIPPFVKRSPYLEALLSNEPFPETGIEVPVGCAKKDTRVITVNDMRELLQTLRFWMVPDVLDACRELLQFAFDPLNEEVLKECAAEFEFTVPSLLQIQTVVCTSKTEVERLKIAISKGWVYLLEFMCDELQYLKQVSGELLNLAAKSGQVESLRYLHKSGGSWDNATLLDAVEGGSLECLKYLVEEHYPGPSKTEFTELLDLASSVGNLAMVQYLWDVSSAKRSRYCKAYIAENGARYGHISILEFVREQNSSKFATPLSAVNVMLEAICGKQLCSLKYLYSIGQTGNEDVMSCAVQVGALDCVQFLVEKNCPGGNDPLLGEHVMNTEDWEFAKQAFALGIPWNERTMAAVAGRGMLEAMQYLRERGCPWTESTCISAAFGGHVSCLQYAHENGCPWDLRTCSNAAQHGNIDCLRYARESGCPWQEISAAAPQGDMCISARAALAPTVDCLKYVVENGAPLELVTSTCAATWGQLPVMEYLLSVGCPCDAHTCEVLTRVGNIVVLGEWTLIVLKPDEMRANSDLEGCLRLLHAHGCTWGSSTCCGAILHNNMPCFRFAVENGGPWDHTVCSAAARAGSLEGLRFAREHGCPWNSDTCRDAAGRGSLECLKYAHENDCPWDASTCRAAARKSLECLQYAHESGCPWTTATCTAAAASGGSLQCLRYAHENGCPWDVDTCVGAASHRTGDQALTLLQYTHEHGCPWNAQACSTASILAHIDCLVYLHENGCPWDEETCRLAGVRNCYEYAVENGCPGAELSAFVDPMYDMNDVA